MIARTIIVLSFFAAMYGIAAGAGNTRNETARTLCNPDKIGQTNAWVACLQSEAKRSEEVLSKLIVKIESTMSAADMLEKPVRLKNVAVFKSAQTNWFKLRDEDCKAYAAHAAGLGFGAAQVRLECVVDDTLSRIRFLSSRYEVSQ